MPRYLTADELADHLSVSRAHIYNLLHRGMPSVKIGRCRRFDPDVALAWLDAQDDRLAGGDAA